MRKHVTKWSHRIRIPSGQRHLRLSRLKLNLLHCRVGSGQAKLIERPITFGLPDFKGGMPGRTAMTFPSTRPDEAGLRHFSGQSGM